MTATVPSMIGQFNMRNIDLLIKLGYEVDVACDFTDVSVWPEERTEAFKNELERMGIHYYQVDYSRKPTNIRRHISAYKQIRSLIVERQYSFIHTHTPIASAVLRIAAHENNVRVIYTAHGFHFYHGSPFINWIIYYPIEKTLSKWTDTLITINLEDYELARRKFKAKRVVHVPGAGIDIKAIESILIDKNSIRESLGIDKDDIMILSVGELSKRKNHQIVLEALRLIKRDNKSIDNIHYFICGTGILRDSLEKKSKECGVNCHLLGYRSDIVALCKSSNLFVFPSLQEGLPVALMEAIACKTPVICSKIRGNVDLVTESKMLFDSLDAKELRDKLMNFFDKYNKDENSVLENSKRLEKCDVSIILKTMNDIYTYRTE